MSDPSSHGGEDGDQSDAEWPPQLDAALENIYLPLPARLGRLLGIRRHELVIETTVSQKIRRDHPGDFLFLERIALLVEDWQFAGPSPKGTNRIEIYGQLDEVWFTVVVRADSHTDCAALVTMHRIYRRKLESRLRRGYLETREG